MKISKKFVAYTVVLLIVIAYLFYANDIFNKLIKTDREAKLVSISLPAETQNIKFNIDQVKREALKWKDALYMRGWVFKENVKSRKRDVYLVLKSKTGTLIFEIEKNNISRPDVSAFFHLDGGIHSHGFDIYIPLYRLKENSYRIGFSIVDETGKYYSESDKSLRISKDSVYIGDYASEFISHPESLSLNRATKEIMYHFGIVDQSEKFINIQGWGFLNGLDAKSLKSYILLKKNEKVLVFDVIVQPRTDVTSYFATTGLNLDYSGFQAKIPMENMEKGNYQVGLYIVRGDQTGVVYSDKIINIAK